MTWEVRPNEEMTAHDLYRLSKRHRLIPAAAAEAADAIESFNGLVEHSLFFDVFNEENEAIGTVVVSEIIPGSRADLDLIPVPKHFTGPSFRDDFKMAMLPVLRNLIDTYRLTRINAEVPESRFRTKKALVACGFEHEGRRRMAAHYDGNEPEDMIIMGLLAEDLET